MGADLAVLASLLMALAALLTALSNRRKNQVEASATISDAAVALVAPLEKRIGELETKYSRLQEISRLMLRELRSIKPDWKPPAGMDLAPYL